MGREAIDSFPPSVVRELKYYVYRLIDPRNGETFYVGKGKGNRVFAHIRGESGIGGDELDNKLKRIREIRLAGFEVAHVIHRHGLDEATAFQVEAALLDAYPGLTNAVGGVGSECGAMHAAEIVERYAAKPAEFYHKALLISVTRSAEERSLYEAVRFAWKISRARAREVELVLATVQGLIRGVYIPEHWLEATSENFPGREDVPGRVGFVGRDAPEEVKRLYLNKRVPDRFRKRGASNPVKYSWSA